MLTLASRVAPGAPSLERKELFALSIALGRYVADVHEEGRTVDDFRPAALELEAIGSDFVVRRAQGVEAPSPDSPEAVLARSPEQLRDADFVSPTADVYGAAVLIYRLAAGRPPFGGESFHEMLLSIADGAADPLEKLRPDLGAPLGEAVRRAMAADPALRFPDGQTLLSALEEAREAGPVSSSSPLAAAPTDTTTAATREAEGSADGAEGDAEDDGEDEASRAATGRFLLQLTLGLLVVLGLVAVAYRTLAPRRKLPPSTPSAALSAARAAASEYREKTPPPATSTPP